MQQYQSTQCAQSLIPLLQQQLDQVNLVTTYLEAIKQAITQNNKDELNQLLSSTTLDVEKIEMLQLKQQQIIAEFGFSSSSEGMESCVMACQQPQLTSLYRELNLQLKGLQNSLLINDLLVKKNQQRIRQSIRLLSGHQPANGSVTYSSKGNTTEDTPASHSLARA